MTNREYTSWAIIGSGEGGGRIASQFLTRTNNPGIDDRIVIINTHHADIQQTLDRVEERLSINRETVNREHVGYFGSEAGVGNDFFKGEEMVQEDFDEILRPMNNTLAGADAFLYTLGLGGGSGNGSVPYITQQVDEASESKETTDLGGDVAWMRGLNQIALAAWPYRDDPIQQHFNAVCGLSRLLMTEDGEPNTDLTILVSNSHLEERAASRDGRSDGVLGSGGQLFDRNERVNTQIIPAVDLLISAGRHSVNTVDVNDFIRKPQSRGIYHATFGIALEKPIGLDIKRSIEKAAENTYVPLDLTTCGSAYVVVRCPENRIQNGDVTMASVSKAFNRWKSENGLRRAVGMPTLSRKQGNGNTMDVLLLLGGFDLENLLEDSWDLYEDEKELLGRTDDGRAQRKRVETIEQNLEAYIEKLKQ